MTTSPPQARTQLAAAADQIWAACDCMTQLVIKHLDPVLWQAKPPGGVRTITAIVSHLHNVRAKWVRLSAPRLGVVERLHGARVTPEMARAALAESAAVCGRMVEEGFRGDGRNGRFIRG